MKNDNQGYLDFLAFWQEIVFILIFVAVAIGILVYLYYKLRYFLKKSDKEKFDWVSKAELKFFLWTHIFFAIAIFCTVNTMEYETMQLKNTWFYIRLFVGFSLGFLHGYVAHLVLKYYYPGRVEKKLGVLRYTPRINPNTGQTMKLLSEDEEDAYLDEGMQMEENLFSVDYDVWVDSSTGYVQIEKYKGHLNALKCDRCGFQTLKLGKEEVVREATDMEDGELLKEYKCSYCNRVKRKTVVLSYKIKQDVNASQLIDNPLVHDRRIVTIKLEIHSNQGSVRNYEFQSMEQTKQFIEEFDYKKLEEEIV